MNYFAESPPQSSAFSNVDLDQLQEWAKEANRPSELFLQAVQDIGETIGLDPEKIVAGTPIQCNGLTFWLGHHGQEDPEGMMLRIHMGSVPPEFESVMLRRMLEHNAMTAAAVNGYYSVMPGTDIAVLSVRLNLGKSARPCDAILAYVGLFAKQVQEIDRVVRAGVDEMLGQHAPAAGQAGHADTR
jgi:hypothetical protein